jgi:uncharacterized metal-binding protein
LQQASESITVAQISMPSGKTHLRIEAMILVLWAALSILFVLRHWITSSQALLFLGTYVFSMFLLSPDLDLSKSDAFGRWGILRWIWLPYAWLFRHRQVSHHPLWGPASRISYIAILVLSATLIYLVSTGRPGPRLRLSFVNALPVLLGLYLPNIEHICADRISTARRRKRRRRQL